MSQGGRQGGLGQCAREGHGMLSRDDWSCEGGAPWLPGSLQPQQQLSWVVTQLNLI